MSTSETRVLRGARWVGVAAILVTGAATAMQTTTAPDLDPTPPASPTPAASPTLAFAAPKIDDRTIVLFDGTIWNGWHQRDGAPSAWVVQDDGSVLVKGGDAVTERTFRDFQLHLEFLCPEMPEREGQARANSGVYLHGRYEVQVLDTHGMPPFESGCAAIYSIAAPEINASRPAGAWQTYDIVFLAPRLDEDGRMHEPGRVTVIHNGIVVHNNLALPHTTPGGLDERVLPAGPILLQDHGDPVRYRNIWVRELSRARRGLMRLLIVTAVPAEAAAIGQVDDALVLAGGIGRTNAAAATTDALLRHGPFDAVLGVGVGGALPATDLAVGDTVVASRCVYFEEGIVTRHGFADLASIGLALGDFDGNTVPVDEALLERLSEILPVGPIATVATCSGTDEAAQLVRDRTGAVVEAMEGAAVVHAARRLRIPAIEVRTVSNRTGDRERQGWDLPGALAALGRAITDATTHLRDLSGQPAQG